MIHRLLCLLPLLVLSPLYGEEAAAKPPPAPEPIARALSTEDAGKRPFGIGETLRYRLAWGVLTVGNAVMRVSGPEEIDGRPCLRFSLGVRTSGIAETFYKVRTDITGWVDLDMEQTRYYRKAQLEGKTHRDIEVRFDPQQGLAFYFNWGELHPPCEVSDGAFDPLSAIFYFRMLELAAGDVHTVRVTDGKKLVEGSVAVEAREKCTVPLGTFWAFRVEPSLGGVGGVFKQSPGASMEIWLSDDAHRIPVKMEGEVVVGKFRAELESVELGIGSDREVLAWTEPDERETSRTGPRR